VIHAIARTTDARRVSKVKTARHGTATNASAVTGKMEQLLHAEWLKRSRAVPLHGCIWVELRRLWAVWRRAG
jgi:hypothetical protein